MWFAWWKAFARQEQRRSIGAAQPYPGRVRLCIEELESRCVPTLLTVNATYDQPQTGALTFRDAIEVANGDLAIGSLTAGQALQVTDRARAGFTIKFDIAGGLQILTPAFQLDSIRTARVVIDGTAPADHPDQVIRLDGEGGIGDGLTIDATATDCTIANLEITRFSGSGIKVAANSTTIQGCYIGTSHAGEELGNRASGVLITGASSNVIGVKENAAQGNTVAFNGLDGVRIETGTAASNQVAGNLIAYNTGAGVSLRSAGSNNIIGYGTTATGSDGNVILANTGNGISIDNISGDSGGMNLIRGNYIGINLLGDTYGNSGSGIFIHNSSANVIGGDGSAFGNDKPSSVYLAGNKIAANGRDGVEINGGSGNVLQGNFIGTDNFAESITDGVDSTGNARPIFRTPLSEAPPCSLSLSVSRVAEEPRLGLTVVPASGILIAARRGLAPWSGGWHGRLGPDAFAGRSAHTDGTGGTVIRWYGAALPAEHRSPHFDDKASLSIDTLSMPTASGKPMPLPAEVT